MKTRYLIYFIVLFISHSQAQSIQLPYSTGFDNTAQQAGWEEFRTGYESTYSWGISGSGNSAPSCISHDYNVGGSDNQVVIDWYVSPALDLSNASHISLKVKSSGFSTPTEDNCEVYYGIGSQDPELGTFTLLTNISVATPQFSWIDFEAAIPAIGDEAYIAIKYKTIGAAWMTYAIDDILIEESNSVTPSLSDSENAPTISIFPNPAGDFIHIQLKEQSSNSELVIKNSLGQNIATFSNLNSTQITISTSNFASGVYFLYLNEGKEKGSIHRFNVR